MFYLMFLLKNPHQTADQVNQLRGTLVINFNIMIELEIVNNNNLSKYYYFFNYILAFHIHIMYYKMVLKLIC